MVDPLHIFTDASLWSLFCLSFAASTILPLGSEWLLVLMIADGYPLFSTVLVATTGNFLGACTTYVIGRWGADFVIYKVLGIDDLKAQRAERVYQKWGIWSLLLSWVPLVGDPLCFIAGVFRIHPLPFSILVISGKCLRYLFIGWMTAVTLTGP